MELKEKPRPKCPSLNLEQLTRDEEYFKNLLDTPRTYTTNPFYGLGRISPKNALLRIKKKLKDCKRDGQNY
jgi:hypothetical protein